MKPVFDENNVQIYHGDCRQVLAQMPAESVDCVVTSPPYWGLRDYGVDGQIGLEQTPKAFVAEMVGVFRAARRVLSNKGTLWLNLGDSYGHGTSAKRQQSMNPGVGANTPEAQNSTGRNGGIAKQLVGVPWRVAFALQEDGWILRSEIIWHKPNAMPESVGDRPTKSHEHIFLLSKSERYYYNFDAIKEMAETEPHAAGYVNGSEYAVGPMNRGGHSQREGDQTRVWGADGKRNKRSVWSVPVQPFAGAHFATFPPDLITPCIKAGVPDGGVCLDPFFGAGTTGLVCQQQHVRCIGIELNPAYIEIASKRLSQGVLNFTEAK